MEALNYFALSWLSPELLALTALGTFLGIGMGLKLFFGLLVLS